MAIERRQSVVPLNNPDSEQHRRQIAQGLNQALDGKLNSTGTVTLTASVTTTVITDQKIGTDSRIILFPTTANAAADIAAGDVYISSKGKKTATITHPSNANADKTYDYVILG